MISELFESACRCGSRRLSRLYGEETPRRISYVTLCETCGRLDRAVYSDTEVAHPPRITTASPN
jgi:hypothetical protein